MMQLPQYSYPAQYGLQQQQLLGSSLPMLPLAASSGPTAAQMLGGIFTDCITELRAPSPPPLPTDFHCMGMMAPSMMFNFSQFSQKLPKGGWEPGADSLDFDSGDGIGQTVSVTDDGDLMHM